MGTRRVIMGEHTDLLRRLERDNRILKSLVVSFLVLMSIMMVRAQQPAAERLEAQAFVLSNEVGDTRATLALLQDLPVLTLFDRNDQALLRLAITPNGPALAATEGGRIRNHLVPEVDILPRR
jgi:hypothetical protein